MRRRDQRRGKNVDEGGRRSCETDASRSINKRAELLTASPSAWQVLEQGPFPLDRHGVEPGTYWTLARKEQSPRQPSQQTSPYAKRRAEDARADSQLAQGYFRRLRTREGEKCEANHGAGAGLREVFSANGSSAMQTYNLAAPMVDEEVTSSRMATTAAYLSHTRSVTDRWKVLCPRRAQGEEEGFGAAMD
ncbi:unnamed protein product [Leuciscus chuanchicus]